METLIEEKVEIAPELLQQIAVEVEKQVTVHGLINNLTTQELLVRVWPTIYLIPKDKVQKCKLLHHFNIAMHPEWQYIKRSNSLQFTLIFEGLPKGCDQFDLVEIIPEDGAFEVRNISRNKQDVYFVKI
jgi:hypothetical protein